MRVLVIGSGIIGAAVAEALAHRGAQVTVLDMRGPGRGASQASAGVLAPYTEAHRRSPLLALGTRSLDLFDEFVERVRERSGRAVEYARTGTLEVAFDEADADRLRSAGEWLRAEGVEANWLDRERAREFEPALGEPAAGALFVPCHGFVAVPALVDAVVDSARFAGAVFETPVEAATVTPDGAGGTEVSAGERRWQADRVLVAAGSWSGRVRIAGATRLPVRPVRGQLLHLDWRDGPRPGRVVWGPGCYAVPWSNGSVLIGATVEEAGFDESSTLAGVRDLAAEAHRLLPAAALAGVRDIRVGLRPATPDGLPAIGVVAPGVVEATGHYRNGILLAPLTAELVCRLLLDDDRDPAMDLVDPCRAPAPPPPSFV